MNTVQRILFVIIHYFNPDGDGSLGSLRNDPARRASALGKSITALHDLFNYRTVTVDFRTTLIPRPANTSLLYDIDVTVLTTQDKTVFAHLDIDSNLFSAQSTTLEPTMLGFGAPEVFQTHMDEYDWFVYLEDDIILHDPFFFCKLAHFQKKFGTHALLQPNRYEVTERDRRGKVYIDGDLVPDQVACYRNLSRQPEFTLSMQHYELELQFCLAPNPHSGCYFLSRAQLALWMQKPWFLDRDTGFVRSFESAASLGILKTFDVYKPDAECAAFLEVQHAGEDYLAQIRPQATEAVLHSQTTNNQTKPLELRVTELTEQIRYLEQQLRQLQPVPMDRRNAQLEGEVRHLATVNRNQALHIKELQDQINALTANTPQPFRVSVIIPLYNGERYIQAALDSVVRQSLLPLEIIIVNDGSTDEALAWLEKYKSPVDMHIIHQDNAGQSAARNHGARVAKGNVLAFLDQDDVWYPHHLQRLVEPFYANSQLGWTYSDIDEIDRYGRVMTKAYLATQGIAQPKRSLIEFIVQDLFILPSTALVRKEAFEAVKGFDESLSGCEDDDLFLRLFLAGYDTVYLPEPLSQWRVRFDSASSNQRMVQSRDIYAQKLLNLFPDEPLMVRYYSRDCIAPRFYHLAAQQYRKFLLLKQWNMCRHYVQRMRFYNRLLPKSVWSFFQRNVKHRLMLAPEWYYRLFKAKQFLLPWQG